MKELTPFVVLYDIPKLKLYSREDFKKSGCSAFHLLNYIRSEKRLIPYASYLNQNHKMDLYNMYLFIFMTVRFYNIKYIKWEKIGKEVQDKDIDSVQSFYKVKRQVAIDYLQHMSKEELEYIKSYE